MRSIIIDLHQNLENYVFCYKCNKIYVGHNITAIIESHPEHDKQSGLDFPGVFVLPEFISPNEKNALMIGIDSLPWDISQSGRRKQVSELKKRIFEIMIFDAF